MGNQLLQYSIEILIGVVSSLVAYLLTKKIERNSKADMSEYKTLSFYLGFISIICSVIAVLGFIVSIISLWKNGKRLSSRKTKAYVIAFFASIVGLTISSANATIGGVYAWYYYNQDNSTFNTRSNDVTFLRTYNRTTTPKDLSYDAPNFWRQWINAKLNDTLSFAMWYHNTADRSTRDVHLKFDYNQYGNVLMCGAELNEEFHNNVLLGFSDIYITDYSGSLQYRLDFIRLSWFANQKLVPVPLPFDQTGIEIMANGGLNIGSIENANWEHQGVVVFDVVIHRKQ